MKKNKLIIFAIILFGIIIITGCTSSIAEETMPEQIQQIREINEFNPDSEEMESNLKSGVEELKVESELMEPNSTSDIEKLKLKVEEMESIAESELKEFHVESYQFGYEPNIIEVNLGDTVKISGTSRDVPHSLFLPTFGVDLYMDKVSRSIEFVADKQGTFRWGCAVSCGRGHGVMGGKLIVS